MSIRKVVDAGEYEVAVDQKKEHTCGAKGKSTDREERAVGG